MYLLKMASNQQPAADDLVPVLIYVIIKVFFIKIQITLIILILMIFLGKSTLLTIDNKLRRVLHRRKVRRRGALLVDAILSSNTIHQDDD